MALTVTHNFASVIPDDPIAQANGEILPSHWNDTHDVTGTIDPGDVSGLSEAIDDRVAALLVAGANIGLVYDDGAGTLTITGTAGGGANTVRQSVDFGASFTDKAQAVVTGQAWVTANSNIVPQVLTPAGVDVDEMYLLKFLPVVSGIVPGTGFTITLYSEPEARGVYDVMCLAA